MKLEKSISRALGEAKCDRLFPGLLKTAFKEGITNAEEIANLFKTQAKDVKQWVKTANAPDRKKQKATLKFILNKLEK